MYKYLIFIISIFFLAQPGQAQNKVTENKTIKTVKKELHKNLNKTSKFGDKTWKATKRGSKKIYEKTHKSGEVVLKKVKEEAPKKWNAVKKGTKTEYKKLKKKINIQGLKKND